MEYMCKCGSFHNNKLTDDICPLCKTEVTIPIVNLDDSEDSEFKDAVKIMLLVKGYYDKDKYPSLLDAFQGYYDKYYGCKDIVLSKAFIANLFLKNTVNQLAPLNVHLFTNALFETAFGEKIGIYEQIVYNKEAEPNSSDFYNVLYLRLVSWLVTFPVKRNDGTYIIKIIGDKNII